MPLLQKSPYGIGSLLVDPIRCSLSFSYFVAMAAFLARIVQWDGKGRVTLLHGRSLGPAVGHRLEPYTCENLNGGVFLCNPPCEKKAQAGFLPQAFTRSLYDDSVTDNLGPGLTIDQLQTTQTLCF